MMRRLKFAALGMAWVAAGGLGLAACAVDEKDPVVCEPACGTGFDCVEGTCVEKACDPACETGYECKLGACVEKGCEPACETGYECELGACVEKACDPACETGYECELGACVEKECDPACGTGYECKLGACVELGCDPACETGYECKLGACVEKGCDPACGDGKVCELGVCVDKSCDPACETGFTCVGGECKADVCDPVCGGGYVCRGGACEMQGCDPTCTDGKICVEGVCLGANPHRDNPMLAGPFANGPAVTAKCTTCHAEAAADLMATSHWTWKGPTPGMEGHKTGTDIGKVNLINNFCVAITSNEGRCTQCHAGYGWKDDTFDFASSANIDCLVCHDTTGKYAKAPTTAGGPTPTSPLGAAARSVGRPSRAACGACHFHAGGGDNVKKGDLGSWAANPTEAADVHMGRGMDCVDCHGGKVAANPHIMAGGGLHDPIVEAPLDCVDCHQGPVIHTTNATVEAHTKHIACQTCHIPAFSRQQPTKIEWYWSTAGDASRVPVNDEFGKPDYDKMKGNFVWGKNVEPELAWWNGSFTRMVIGDVYASEPVDLGSPVGDIDDAQAKIYPFKRMVGDQPADTVRKVLAVPHLWGPSGGANPYWTKYDWALAISEGMAKAGLEYSGTFGFVDTFMYMAIDHEVAPKTQARGCMDCHGGAIDFTALGYDGDPMTTQGKRHATE